MIPVVLPTKRSIRGFPLRIEIVTEPGEHDKEWFIIASIPMRSIDSGIIYESPFASRVREEEGKDVFGYAKLKVDLSKENKGFPIYLQEFFVFSSVLKFEAAADERSRGLGHLLLCTLFSYLFQQKWFRSIAVSIPENIYLKAGGGQCSLAHKQHLENQDWTASLRSLMEHTATIRIMMGMMWMESGWNAEQIIESLQEFSTVPESIKKGASLVAEEEDNEEDEEEFGFDLSKIDSLTALFSDRYQSRFYNILVQMNEEYPEWNIPERVIEMWCTVQDNLKLAKHYSDTYGFRIDDASDGLSIRMVSRVKNILDVCHRSPLEGKRARRSKRSKQKHRRKFHSTSLRRK